MATCNAGGHRLHIADHEIKVFAANLVFKRPFALGSFGNIEHIENPGLRHNDKLGRNNLLHDLVERQLRRGQEPLSESKRQLLSWLDNGT